MLDCSKHALFTEEARCSPYQLFVVVIKKWFL